jgi:hypothetical protein
MEEISRRARSARLEEFLIELSELRLGESEARRRWLRFCSARDHLRSEERDRRKSVDRRQNDLHTGHHKLRDVDRSRVRCFAARDFAVGQVHPVLATVHRHFVFAGYILVMMSRNRAVIADTASHTAREPRSGCKRRLQQSDGEQANDCCPTISALNVWRCHGCRATNVHLARIRQAWHSRKHSQRAWVWTHVANECQRAVLPMGIRDC